MIDWKACTEALPNDKDECIIYSDENDAVVGPIIYKEDLGAWIDLFATKEAGHFYQPGKNGPTHWAIWNAPKDAAQKP